MTRQYRFRVEIRHTPDFYVDVEADSQVEASFAAVDEIQQSLDYQGIPAEDVQHITLTSIRPI